MPTHPDETRKGILTHEVAPDSDEVPGASPHPTLVPAFDPQEYAEEFETRERMPTLTDASVLEEARLQSFRTDNPPPRRGLTTAPPRANPRDSSVEIDVSEDNFDELGPEEQIAILRSGLGPLSRVPTLARELSELGPALADPKTAYLVGFIDGILPLETIIDVTGLPELDTLRVLDKLIAQGLVVFRRLSSARART